MSLAAALAAPTGLDAQTELVRQYQIDVEQGEPQLVLRQIEYPTPGEGEVVVRVHATSLNRRDLSILTGGRARAGLVPLSDGAGEVVAVGPGVTRFAVGDRVAGTFFANWDDGRRTDEVNPSARGGAIDGMLSEVIVSPEGGLVAIPDYLSYEEAASLPCAAVTAWRGLFVDGELRPGDYVLLEGTGGVSIFGLQLAVAGGALPIITSSSDDKLATARAMGAVGTVNYRTNPEWQDEVRALTGGQGVAHVLEIGGQETLPRAMQALGYGGHMAFIGGLSGFAGSIPTRTFIGMDHSVTGIYVGSRADFEAMLEFMETHRIRPVIDRVFDFEDAPAAFDYMASGAHLGKIVIRH